MQDLQLFDESFDTLRSSNYHLSLQVSRSTLAACVLDLLTRKYIAFASYLTVDKDFFSLPKRFQEIMNQDPIFKLKYKSASCALINDKST